jgi:hypothetical protein
VPRLGGLAAAGCSQRLPSQIELFRIEFVPLLESSVCVRMTATSFGEDGPQLIDQEIVCDTVATIDDVVALIRAHVNFVVCPRKSVNHELMMADSPQMDFRAFTVVKREGADDFWLPIGAAFRHSDGEGLNLVFQALPVDGRIVLRVPKDDNLQPGEGKPSQAKPSQAKPSQAKQ